MGDDDFVRLAIYAPFIKTLEVFQDENRRYSLLRWNVVLEYALRHTLLPNLTSVQFANLWLDSYPQYPWMAMFVSPALQSFHVIAPSPKSPPDIPFLTAYVLLKKLLGECYELSSLSLFPDLTLEPHEDEVALLEDISRGIPAPRPGCGSTLREMTVSSTIFSVFEKLGYPPMPSLEHLRIYVNSLDDIGCAPPGQDVFPRVRRLSLFNLMYETTLCEIWHTLAPTVVQLTHVELHFQPRYWSRCIWPQRSYVLFEIVSFLIARSPRIVDLSLRAPPSFLDQLPSISALTTIEALRTLPLEKLCIFGACVDDFFTPNIRLGNVFAKLNTLKLPHQYVSTSTLYHFADEMPNLEYLSLDLRLNHAAETPERGTSTSRPVALRCLESNFQHLSPLGDRFLSDFALGQYASGLGFARYVWWGHLPCH